MDDKTVNIEVMGIDIVDDASHYQIRVYAGVRSATRACTDT